MEALAPSARGDAVRRRCEPGVLVLDRVLCPREL